MELGGVSVPGRGLGTMGAYLLKDLTVFESQLGGLKAFIMVSDSTSGPEGGVAASQLAVSAADAYLESILMDVAVGKSPSVEPALTLKAIVAKANAAIIGAADETVAEDMSATFVGMFISADKGWLGQVGEGGAYRLRGDEARQLIVAASEPDVAPPESVDTESDEPAQAEVVESMLGNEGVEVEVGAVDLAPGDAVVLLGRGASTVLSASDILGLACASCDAQVAAAGLADEAAKSELDHSVTVALWSADSAMFTPVPLAPEPVAEPVIAAAPVTAEPGPDSPAPATVASDASDGQRSEKIFLWAMSAWIVVALLVMVGLVVYSKYSAPAPTVADASDTTADPASQGSTVSTATQVATAVPDPADAMPAGFPKTLTVPKKVRGGVWLRLRPDTLGGSNEVVQLKAGSVVQAVDTESGTDEKGRVQEFYVFRVSDISASQVAKSKAHPWPPAKSIEKVYAFSGSFE